MCVHTCAAAEAELIVFLVALCPLCTWSNPLELEMLQLEMRLR